VENLKTSELPQTRIDISKSETIRKAAARLIPGSAAGPEDASHSGDGPRGPATSGTGTHAARDGVGAPPVIAKGKGATLTDVDGKEYIDYVCANGALMLGHGDERIIAAVHKAASKGWGFPSLTEMSVRLAELVAGRFSSIDMVRLLNSQADAVAGAIRLARAYTGRDRIVVIEGCLRRASPGLPTDQESVLLALDSGRPSFVVPHNDADAAENLFREHGSLIAGMIVDPVATGRGLIPPADGFLMTLRRLCDKHGAVLIFDESVTGFRVAPGGAAALFEVMPDLICLGPALGGGLPLAAYGGRKDLMRLISSAWGVDHTIGASQANAVAIAAGIATLEAMSEPGFYEDLEAKSVRLDEGLRAAAAAAKAATSHSRAGSLIGMSFTSERVRTEALMRSTNTATPNREAARWTRYYHAMLDRGIFLPPAPTACICVSAAHTDDQIDQTIEMAHDVLRVIRAEGDE